MTTDEQKDYIRDNYKKFTGQFMAKMLGIRPERVYSIVKELGLKKQQPPPSPKPKADMRKNPTADIPGDNDQGKVPLRIDCRTIVLIPRGVNPETYKKKYLRKMDKARQS